MRAAERDAAITVISYTDAPGHTEYLVRTQLAAGGPHHDAQHRFNAFRTLHASIQVELGLAAAFPLPKLLFNTDSTKQERVGKLQEYLRDAVAAATRRGAGMPLALRAFLNLPDTAPACAPAPSPPVPLRPRLWSLR